ncbi:TlpA family protein disulfide reductase [Spirosoma sp. KUDC1026]|uniref:TlpA family protein disulfide reductase n=1 Tax=Spirosoma sp. KUDC1026 TaxID=2745947 RepID=UPI00159B86C9|nr:TlpA disulfide reductase family protein [Spirosoma sp. KUDC1026]QKZ12894.1 TlpA family protein disulfide reductase [Spirosoma sp. KUDC1026]
MLPTVEKYERIVSILASNSHNLKMKRFLHQLPFLIILTCSSVKAQSPTIQELLKKVDQAVTKFDQGQFTLQEKSTQISVGEDSTTQAHTYTFWFKRNRPDSLVGYKIASFRKDGYEQLYDGTDLLTRYEGELTVTPTASYPDRIRQETGGATFLPLFAQANIFLQSYGNSELALQNMTLLEPENYAGETCYRIAIKQPTGSGNEVTSHCFISATSFLPIRMRTTMKKKVGQAQEVAVFDYAMINIEAKSIPDEQFGRERLSTYTVEKVYNPTEEVIDELLPIGTAAPDWTLPLVSGNTLRLQDLRGKLVVMDFWYKACVPCRTQMITLEKLHGKFNPDEVVFVGVNTMDDPVKDKLAVFLKNRNISMPSVYRGKAIQARYKVQGLPALFIIDQRGNVLYTASGYSDTLLSDVDNVLSAQLKK